MKLYTYFAVNKITFCDYLVMHFYVGFCNTRKIYTFVKCLHQQWQQLALYLGYTQEEIDAIVERCPPNDINYQIKMFLRLWWMPNCGTMTQGILDDLKRCAGITSASDVDMQIYCPHKTKGDTGLGCLLLLSMHINLLLLSLINTLFFSRPCW